MNERPRDRTADRNRYAVPPTAASLSAAAARYVSRYTASTEQVRRVLMRRVHRARSAGAEIDEEIDKIVEQVVARLVRAGALDDNAFAQQRVGNLRRRGESGRRIAQRLALAGIDRESGAAAIAAVMAENGHEDSDSADFSAAIRFARRRKLGPFRDGERSEKRQRDLAAMARAGFAMSIARRVIDAAEADELTC